MVVRVVVIIALVVLVEDAVIEPTIEEKEMTMKRREKNESTKSGARTRR